MNKIIIFFGLMTLLGGCAVDPLEDMDPIVEEEITNPEAIHAWVWAFNSTDDSVYVLHTIDKLLWERFGPAAVAQNGFYSGGLVGGGIYPTLWTWQGPEIYSLTNGILDHSDHGHIVRPKPHKTITLAPSWAVTGMSVSPDGSTIIASAVDTASPAASGNVISIRNQTGEASFFTQGAPVSMALAAGSSILTAWEHSTTAALLDASSGSMVKSIAIDTLVSSDVYHDETATAFLACKTGIEMIDITAGAGLGRLSYGFDGRVTFLYAGKRNNQALGLCKTGGGDCDRVMVLDMSNQSAGEIVIQGAHLASDRAGAACVLSNDGSRAILADMNQPVLYRITLSNDSVEQTVAPAAACPVACNWDGSRVWALARDKAYQVSFKNNSIVDSIPVPAHTGWIMVTSFRDNNALFDTKDHIF